MPSFMITNEAPTSATIVVYADPAYPWYKIYARDNVPVEQWDGSYYEEGWYNSTSTFYIDVEGLTPGSSYLANVAYSTEREGDDAKLIGTQGFSTPDVSLDSKVYINGLPYIPHIYFDGAWHKASPHIYSDGWRSTEG